MEQAQQSVLEELVLEQVDECSVAYWLDFRSVFAEYVDLQSPDPLVHFYAVPWDGGDARPEEFDVPLSACRYERFQV